MSIKNTSENYMKLISDMVINKIKRDFIKKDVSYVQTKLIRMIGLKKTVNSKTELARFLKDNLNASYVSVGNKEVAVVKRKDGPLNLQGKTK